MLYSEMTNYAKVQFIKEIIEYAPNESTALEYIRAFMDGEMTQEEINDLLL